MNAEPAEESDEEFLARYEGKWFQAEIKKLLRIETALDQHIGFDADRMPMWSAKMFGKVAEIFEQKPSSPEMTDDRKFGSLLGGKVALASLILGFLNCLEAGSSDECRKLAKFFNSLRQTLRTFSERKTLQDLSVVEIRAKFRQVKPIADKIVAIKKKAIAKVQHKNLSEQGRFFEGYGHGLLVFDRMRDWDKTAPLRQQKSAYIRAFAFFNWQKIHECSENGKWGDLLEEFTRSLPDGVEISEDAFQKDLRRAGLGSFGKRGRPEKTRTTK